MASTHLKKVGTRPCLPLCGIPSSFYNSLQTSGDWGDKLLKFRNRNVVPFLSNTGFLLFNCLRSSLSHLPLYDAPNVFYGWKIWTAGWPFHYIYIYIYAFSRRFYPKRLTLHSSYSFTFYQLLLSLGIEPMILALLAQCSTIWATGKLFQYPDPSSTQPWCCNWCSMWSGIVMLENARYSLKETTSGWEHMLF